MAKRTKTPEGYVKDAVLDLLAAERIFVLRANAGTILLTNPAGKKRAIRLAKKGTADLLAIVPATNYFMPLWCETKFGKNGLSADQVTFRDDVLERGHAYVTAYSSDDVMEWITNFRRQHEIV